MEFYVQESANVDRKSTHKNGLRNVIETELLQVLVFEEFKALSPTLKPSDEDQNTPDRASDVSSFYDQFAKLYITHYSSV